MKHIHKLPFDVPFGVNFMKLSSLECVVSSFFCEVKRDVNSVLGYKGGHYEKDLLVSLSIPSLNLEEYGCPKAEELIKTMIWLETCGHHLVPDAYLHCPNVEVEAYAQWMEKTMNDKV